MNKKLTEHWESCGFLEAITSFRFISETLGSGLEELLGGSEWAVLARKAVSQDMDDIASVLEKVSFRRTAEISRIADSVLLTNTRDGNGDQPEDGTSLAFANILQLVG